MRCRFAHDHERSLKNAVQTGLSLLTSETHDTVLQAQKAQNLLDVDDASQPMDPRSVSSLELQSVHSSDTDDDISESAGQESSTSSHETDDSDQSSSDRSVSNDDSDSETTNRAVR